MPPFNGAGTFNLYTPGNPVVTATVISSTTFNNTMADVASAMGNTMTRDGQSPATANIPLGGNRLTGVGDGVGLQDAITVKQYQNGNPVTLTSVAGTNTITASLTSMSAYTSGMQLTLIAAATNTGSTTININAIGAKNITKNGNTALAAGDLVAGGAYILTYDGTQFQCSGGVGSGAAFVPEVQTATAGQTVFTLANGYTVGTGTVEVYVNGLLTNIGTDYTETSTNVITFTSGLTAGDEVKFIVWRTNIASYGDAGTMSYTPAGTGAFATTVQSKLRESVSVKDFGADPTGVASSSAAITAAIASGAGVITYPAGTYLLSTPVTLASFQTHKGEGATVTSSGTMFTTSGASQQIVFDGLNFAGTGNAIYQSGIYLNANWQIKNCSFAKSLNECVYMSLILSQIENNYFGTNSGSSGAQHRHLYLHATQASGCAINQNFIKGNRFNFGVGSHSIFVQYGAGNTFMGNDFESNACKAVHLDGCGVTNFIGNWFESNASTYQVYAECSATITLSLYYNKAINFIGNTVNTLTPNSTAIFYLDANSYCLSMTGNLIYSNNPTVGSTPTFVTQTPAGNNWGIVQYQNNSNYGSYITDTSGGLVTGVVITSTTGDFSCTATATPLIVNQAMTITGALGGTGTIVGYGSGAVYYIKATNGSTTFTLSTTVGGAAITTTAGTPTGLTYTLGVGSSAVMPNLNAVNSLITGGTFGGPLSTTIPWRVKSITNVDMGFIDSNGLWSMGTYTNSPYNFTTAAAANLVVLSNGLVQRSTSALKYKTDVRDLESIDITKFRPVRYKSKGPVDDPDVDHFGFIADEVDTAGIKELVNYGANGEVEGFQYERMTVVLLKKLLELSADFEAYKSAHQ